MSGCQQRLCLCRSTRVTVTGHFFRIIFREQERDRSWIPRQRDK